ncbi:MAG: SAM-dependent methyltransferase [Balneolaceae bacterium]|nr:SAM-dependent methyltransferase [Balneolaceae bacterium]
MNSGKQSTKGSLYLIPTTLGKTPENNTIPDFVLRKIRELDFFVVENIKSAVRYLQWVGDTVPEYEIEFRVLNKKTPVHEITSFLKPLKDGTDVGLMSEAGCPAVADPGSELVRLAHSSGIRVVPMVGPSSILLALMASGMNGQQFAFHGYLPIDSAARRRQLRKLEQESMQNNRTQIFMEAPQRNDALLNDILESCHPETRFCTATNLTLPDEQVISRSIDDWRKSEEIALGKNPTLFLLHRSP